MEDIGLFAALIGTVCFGSLLLCFKYWDSEAKQGKNIDNHSCSATIAKYALIIGFIAYVVVSLSTCSGGMGEDYGPRHT